MRKQFMFAAAAAAAVLAGGTAFADKISNTAVSAKPQDLLKPDAIPVAADPKGRHVLVSMTALKTGERRAVIRRTSAAGATMTVREFNCAKKTSRLVGEGPTLARALHGKSPGPMSPYAPGATTAQIADYVCTRKL